MAEKTTTIKVVVDASSADRALEVLRGNFKATAEVVKDTGKTVDNTMKDVEKSIKSVDSSLGFLTKAFKAAFVLDAVTSFGQQLYEVNSRFQGFVATMTVVTGSVDASKREFEYLTTIANKYGVSIQSLTSTYSKFAAAGKDSALTHQDLHKIFEAMAMSSNVLHLSVEETRLVFYALQQMVSKGNVTMEELRRQLAEKFPGAVNLMAQALEVPVKELEKLIKAGNVAADQALPKFAEVLMKSFGPASQYAITSLNSVVTRLHNAWFMFIQKLSESTTLLPTIMEAINWFTDSLNNNQGAAKTLGDEIAKVVRIVVDWMKSLTADDVSQFFKAITDIVTALIPILQAGAMVLKGWALILGPVIKDMAELMKLFADGRWKDGFLSFANLGKSFVPGPLRAALEEMERGMKGWKAATEQTDDSNRRASGTIVRLTEETTKYGKATADQIKDLEVEYGLSVRNIAVKTKTRDAISELSAMEMMRSELLKTATDPSKTDAERITAYRQLIAGEKDYVSVMKEAQQEMKQSAAEHKKALDPALHYLAAITKEADALELSREQLQAKNRAMALAGLKGQEHIDMLNKIIEAENRLNALIGIEKWKKESEDRAKGAQQELDQLDRAIKKQEEQTFAVGKTKKEIREYEIAQLQAALATEELKMATMDYNDMSMEEYNLLVKKIAKLRELIGLKSVEHNNLSALEEYNAKTKEWLELWKHVDDYTDRFFKDLIVNGKTAFESLRAELKRFAAELLSLVARKFIFQIIGNVVGGTAGSAALNVAENAGANTVAGSVLSWGGNAMASGLGYTAGFGGMADLAAGWTAQSAFLAGSIESAPIFGTMMGELGAVLANIPVWGWIAAAVIAIGAWLTTRGGGPKTEGQGYAEYDSEGNLVTNTAPGERWITNNMMDPQLNTLMQNVSSGYFGLLHALGGTVNGNVGFRYGAALDTQGDAQNIMHSAVTIGGRTVYERAFDQGRPEDFEALTKTEIARMILGALQNSDLPQGIADILSTVVAETATEEQITAVLQLAQAFQVFQAAAEGFSVQDVIDAASMSATDRLNAQGDSLLELADNTELTTAGLNTLTQSTIAYKQSVAQLVAQMEQAKIAITEMFSGTSRRIEMSGMTDEQKYNFLQTETDSMLAEAMASTDPAQIQRLSQRINQNINDAWDLLTPEQQAAHRAEYIANLERVNGMLTGRITELQNTAVTTMNTNLTTIQGIMTQAATDAATAARTQREAADTNLTAANTPVRVNVNVNLQNSNSGVVNDNGG